MAAVKAYLHHEQDGVENDEEQDEVFERRRGDQPPDVVEATRLFFRDVDFQWFGLDDEIDAGFLCIERVVRMYTYNLYIRMYK